MTEEAQHSLTPNLPNDQASGVRSKRISAAIFTFHVFECIACFSPVVILLGDQLLLIFSGYSFLPYLHIEKKYFLALMLLSIVVCAAVSVEIRSSALDKDAFVSVGSQWVKIEMPAYDTGARLVKSYFSKKLRAEKTASVIGYAALIFITEFSFGCIVAAGIYINYFRG